MDSSTWKNETNFQVEQQQKYKMQIILKKVSRSLAFFYISN